MFFAFIGGEGQLIVKLPEAQAEGNPTPPATTGGPRPSPTRTTTLHR